jgi:malic enzyme
MSSFTLTCVTIILSQCWKALSEALVPAEENEGRIFPDVSRIREVSFSVAAAVLKQAHKEELLQSKPLLDRIERQGAVHLAIAPWILPTNPACSADILQTLS